MIAPAGCVDPGTRPVVLNVAVNFFLRSVAFALSTKKTTFCTKVFGRLPIRSFFVLLTTLRTIGCPARTQPLGESKPTVWSPTCVEVVRLGAGAGPPGGSSDVARTSVPMSHTAKPSPSGATATRGRKALMRSVSGFFRIVAGALHAAPSDDCDTRSSRPPVHAVQTHNAVKRPLLVAARSAARSGAPVSETPTGAPNAVPENRRANSRCEPAAPERERTTMPAGPPATDGASPGPIAAGGVQLAVSLSEPVPP